MNYWHITNIKSIDSSISPYQRIIKSTKNRKTLKCYIKKNQFSKWVDAENVWKDYQSNTIKYSSPNEWVRGYFYIEGYINEINIFRVKQISKKEAMMIMLKDGME